MESPMQIYSMNSSCAPGLRLLGFFLSHRAGPLLPLLPLLSSSRCCPEA